MLFQVLLVGNVLRVQVVPLIENAALALPVLMATNLLLPYAIPLQFALAGSAPVANQVAPPSGE